MATHNAFLFIKPHAAQSDACEALVTEMLANAGVSVTSQGVLGATEIDEQRLIGTYKQKNNSEYYFCAVIFVL
jgi:hypothetical protein